MKINFSEPNTPLAIFTSFLLGFSDACFNTQVQLRLFKYRNYNVKRESINKILICGRKQFFKGIEI